MKKQRRYRVTIPDSALRELSLSTSGICFLKDTGNKFTREMAACNGTIKVETAKYYLHPDGFVCLEPELLFWPEQWLSLIDDFYSVLNDIIETNACKDNVE